MKINACKFSYISSLVSASLITILLCVYYTMYTRYSIGFSINKLERLVHREDMSSNYKQKFIVDGPNCRIPEADPYDSEIQKYISKCSYLPCTDKKLLTYVTKTDLPDRTTIATLHVDPEAIPEYTTDNIQCCYSVVTRGHSTTKPDDTYNISSCTDFQNEVNITQEFIIVKCRTQQNQTSIYESSHSIIQKNTEIKKQIDENERKHNGTRAMSVLLVGLDSVSRLNSMRALPRSVNFLKQNGWVELMGYNKIGDNTFPNLMAALAGMEEDDANKKCHPTKPYGLDNCTFIWNRYKDTDYITAYAEDESAIGTFNYQKNGFGRKPTDFYIRPYMKAIDLNLKLVLKFRLNYCVGPVSSADRILSYALDFATTFIKHATFGLFWMNSFSHSDINFTSSMDNVTLEFLEELTNRGITKNSMIVFFSDHGMRFGDFRYTKVGWLEERLPFIYIHLPEWFQQKFPQEYKNLQTNVHRLTTPYDLYMTMQDVLILFDRTNKVVQSSGCPRCKSLFSEISNNRSCADAAISPHWCMCTSFKQVSPDNITVQEAAVFIVSQVQKYLNDSGIDISKKCVKPTLNKIIKAQIGVSSYKKEVYYLLFIETIPGNAKFEATVSVHYGDSKKNATNLFKLHSSISRLDSYANQSSCMHDSFLKKYCYCK